MPVRLATKVLGLLLFGATAVLAQSPAYEAGQADRKAWEQWFDSLTGEYKSGAEFWAGQRNKPNPGSCYGSAGETLGSWTDGCVDAQRRLATTDARRKNEPDYKLGWNHPNDSSRAHAPANVTSAEAAPQGGWCGGESPYDIMDIFNQLPAISAQGIKVNTATDPKPVGKDGECSMHVSDDRGNEYELVYSESHHGTNSRIVDWKKLKRILLSHIYGDFLMP